MTCSDVVVDYVRSALSSRTPARRTQYEQACVGYVTTRCRDESTSVFCNSRFSIESIYNIFIIHTGTMSV